MFKKKKINKRHNKKQPLKDKLYFPFHGRYSDKFFSLVDAALQRTVRLTTELQRT